MDEKTIYSNRLLGFTKRCSVCGTLISSTGNMQYDDVVSQWFIEYWCPVDEEIFTVFSPDKKQLTEDIAKGTTQEQ